MVAISFLVYGLLYISQLLHLHAQAYTSSLFTFRPQFCYFLFYRFSGHISDVGGQKKNNKIKDLNFFSCMLNNKTKSHLTEEEKKFSE